MVGPDPNRNASRDGGLDVGAARRASSWHAPKGGAAVEAGDGTADDRATTWRRAALAVVALAIALGTFVQAQVLHDAEWVQRGLRMPALGWLEGGRDWLPLLCIGFGLSRLCIWQEGTREALRVFAVVGVFSFATAAALFPGGDALMAATAGVLGVALGLHVESVARVGMFGVVGAAVLAAGAAVAASLASRALDGLAVALAATLVALVVDGARVGAPGPLQRGWFGRLLAWLLVLALVVAAGVSADASQVAVLAGLCAAVLGAAACARLGLAIGAAAVTFAVMFVATPDLPNDGRVLARSGDATVVYRRADQELQLRLDGQVLAAAGPDRDEEPLLLAVLHAFVGDGDLVTMLGRGTGRIEPALRADDRCVVEVRDAWPQLVRLERRSRADGPVAPPENPAAGDRITAPFSRPLAELPAAARQVVCVAELPVAATAHRATETFQRQLRRVVGDGLVLQPIALDRVAPQLLERLLLAAASAHPWNGVYRVGDAAVLVSAGARPAPRPGFAERSADVRWALHRAHLGGASDLQLAFAGTLATAVDGAPATGHDGDSAQRLLARSLEGGATADGDAGLLTWWRRLQSDLNRAKGHMLVLGNDAKGRAEAASIALRFVPFGAPRPWLQAALGLSGRDGAALRSPQLSSRCAHALDPTFFPSPPLVFATLEQPTQELGDLEDEHRVLASARLAERCRGENPLAVGLRSRFPSRCARSLVEALERGQLGSDQALALRELADPFVLDELARTLLPQGRWQDLLTYWRRDLPLPAGLREVVAGLDLEGQKRVATALCTHLDASCRPLIADLLLGDDLELRTIAGTALRAAVGERVPFDAKWPRSRREDAASRLRDLHNRRP